MSKGGIVCAALLAIGVAGSAQAETDFGVRLIGVPHASAPRAVSSQTGDLPGAARVGGRFGRITSMVRSAAHNHAVGGVPNSYHLRGRAIDIARRPGVTHAQIAAALRGAGYQLVESLDEGDHSHFAFGFGGTAPVTTAAIHEVTNWGIIVPPRSSLR